MMETVIIMVMELMITIIMMQAMLVLYLRKNWIIKMRMKQDFHKRIAKIIKQMNQIKKVY